MNLLAARQFVEDTPRVGVLLRRPLFGVVALGVFEPAIRVDDLDAVQFLDYVDFFCRRILRLIHGMERGQRRQGRGEEEQGKRSMKHDDLCIRKFALEGASPWFCRLRLSSAEVLSR